ncbi:hypothetical protein VdG2_00827 [Verticillium dahliae VDG2]|nr:hypothetical protein VdG2_00827 [Verticillium dahliae VDG2]
MDWTSYITRTPLSPEMVQSIHSSDEAMYPAGLPLERLEAWSAVDAARDFSRTKGDAVGVHVFHIEKLVEEVQGDAVRGFARFAVDELVKAAQGDGYVVEGVSALTATEEGRRSFEKLGFAASGYKEVWVKSPSGDGPAVLVRSGPGTAGGIDDGKRSDMVVAEARMMVRNGAS